MRRSPQQLPDFEEHGDESPTGRAFVVPGPAALRMSQEERDKAEANERRREARAWRERQQRLREEEAARGQRELQEQQRRRVQLEDEGRSKLFDTVAAGSMIGMPISAANSLESSDDDEDDDDHLEERPTASPETVQQRIAGRRQLAEAREFAEMGPSMASAAIAQFEAGLGKLMPLLRVGPGADATLRDEVVQAVNAMEGLRAAVRAKQPSSVAVPSSSARGADEKVASDGRSGVVPGRRARHSEPHTHTATSAPSPTAYPGDGMSQPWVSSFAPGLLAFQGGERTPRAHSGRSQAPGEDLFSARRAPTASTSSPGEVELRCSDSLDSLLDIVEDLHSVTPSPMRGVQLNGSARLSAAVPTVDYSGSPIRLPTSPRESVKTAAEQRAEELRQLIVALYQRVNPAALTELPEFFKRYRGREPELWLTVCRKYGHDPADGTSLLVPSPGLTRPSVDEAQSARTTSGQDVRRSMALEHADVAPPPSPDLRVWVPPVPAPGESAPVAATVAAPPPSASQTELEMNPAPESIKKLNVRLSREITKSPAGSAASRKLETLYQDDALVGGDKREGVSVDSGTPLQGKQDQAGDSMVLGASMARWVTREATAAVQEIVSASTGGQLRETAALGVLAAADVCAAEDKLSLAEAAAAAARAPATPSSPLHSQNGSAGARQSTPRESFNRAAPVGIPTIVVEHDSSRPRRSLPKRLDPASPHRPLPGRMTYSGAKGHDTKAAIAASAKLDRQIAAARVVQRAWSRWSLRANEKAKKWKKELELLRWRITALRRDGEDLAAEELEAKLREVLANVDSVKPRELQRRGDPKRRGGVSAFETERLDPWSCRVCSPKEPRVDHDRAEGSGRRMKAEERRRTERSSEYGDESARDAAFSDDEEQHQETPARQRDRSRRGGHTLADDGTEDKLGEEGVYQSDDSHGSWDSWRDDDTAAAQQKLRARQQLQEQHTASEPRRRHSQPSLDSGYRKSGNRIDTNQQGTASRQVASEGKGIRRSGAGRRRRLGHSDRSSGRATSVDEQEDYRGWEDDVLHPRRALPFSDDEENEEGEEEYYYNAHDSDIHEFASQLGSFLGTTHDEDHGLAHHSSWYSEEPEENGNGRGHLGSLDLSPREQVLVSKSGQGVVCSDALMRALQSLEAEIGVGNKLPFRRAVAVFQLHLGALVSGEAERDGLNTIDQRDRTYESRVGKYPSSKLCLKALGFRKQSRGLWIHAGVRGAVDYGDGTVPRAVAGRMLRLLGVAAERGNAPSAGLCRQLEQQTLMALRRGGVVPSSRIDTGQHHRYARTRSSRNKSEVEEDDEFVTNIEAAGMPPVGWRPPGFTPSTVVLKPASGLSALLPSQRLQRRQQQPSASVPDAAKGCGAEGPEGTSASARAKRKTVSVEKLARLARPKETTSPTPRSCSGKNGRENAVHQKAETNKPLQRIARTNIRGHRDMQADTDSTNPDGNDSGIDLTIGAKELTHAATGRNFNQKLFILRPDREPEPEPEPEKGGRYPTDGQQSAAGVTPSTIPEPGGLGGKSMNSDVASLTSAPGPPTPEPTTAPQPAPAPSGASSQDVTTLQRKELAMASSIGVAASMQLIQPRPALQASSGVFSDDEAFGADDAEHGARESNSASLGVDGEFDSTATVAAPGDVERVVQRAEAAVAQARRQGQLKQVSEFPQSTTPSLHSNRPQSGAISTYEDGTGHSGLNDNGDESSGGGGGGGSSDDDDDDDGEISGMPEAFRAGIQAKLSARGAADKSKHEFAAGEQAESVEERARREYADWLQQRIAASLEPS